MNSTETGSKEWMQTTKKGSRQHFGVTCIKYDEDTPAGPVNFIFKLIRFEIIARSLKAYWST